MGTFRTEVEFLDFVKNQMLTEKLTDKFVSDIVKLAYGNDKAYDLLEKWLASSNKSEKLGLEVKMLDLLEDI